MFVPRRADLSVETQNGGIAIADVNGRIDFTALNGGVVLKRVGGAVRGSTTNGGLVIELAGDRWDGESLDVSTTNGGVIMSVPENYSAHLQTGTVNGSVNVDFPVNVQGKLTKQVAFDLGSGGAMVKAMTTNGGVISSAQRQRIELEQEAEKPRFGNAVLIWFSAKSAATSLLCPASWTSFVSRVAAHFTAESRLVAPKIRRCRAWRQRCSRPKPSRCTTFLTFATSSRSAACSKISAQLS